MDRRFQIEINLDSLQIRVEVSWSGGSEEGGSQCDI
jgi:hypothetical protein